MSRNADLARATIECALSLGTREFILCAGARNSPLVMQLEKTKGIRISSFFEERSAGFYALGRAQESERPVCVITTSGTAVAELLPASVEATYTKTPLIWLTADRPRKYRGTGAPQTISQPGIFSVYVENSVDAEDLSELESAKAWKKLRPLHLNVCFDEPLMDGHFSLLDYSNETPVSENPIKYDLIALKTSDYENPFVIVGGLSADCAVEVKKLILRNGWVHYAEALSQLRGDPELLGLQLQAGDPIAMVALRECGFKSVIRMGTVPTLRFWRDLELEFKSIPVLNVAETSFSGLSRESLTLDLVSFFEWEKSKSLDHLSGWRQMPAQRESLLKKDRARATELLDLFKKFPQSEPAMVHLFSKSLPEKSSVYLGNSLPIREWDLAATYQKAQGLTRYGANRGANGIDGQISSFLGWIKPETANFALIGDLTALYDLVGLWAGKERDNCSQRIVIINNGGGQIFKRIFKKDLFLNSHKLGFSSWAQMWGWDYRAIKDCRDLNWPLQNVQEIVELQPDAEQTTQFWTAWDAVWMGT